MQSDNTATQYWVWGVDHVVYGPVELSTLIDWTKDERIVGTTWLFLEGQSTWTPARDLPELKMCLAGGDMAGDQPVTDEAETGPSSAGIRPGSLRRIRVFAEMAEEHLASFLRYLEVIRCKQFSSVVRKGEHGAAMYLVLEGELRARVLIDEKETTLSTMTTGEFFGEISLLDHGPRSADVIANQDSVLLKISSSAIEKIMREAPALAAPFLYSLGKSVMARMRTLTRKYEDSIHWSRAAGVDR